MGFNVLITGSTGLIGSEAVRFYDKRADKVVGIDNNMRAEFFGADGSTDWNRRLLEAECRHYHHMTSDIRDRKAVSKTVADLKPDLVVHAAAQPSHDLAARIPFTDFEVNAVGTLNLIEAVRAHCPESVFVFMSTNKVYGDGPNRVRLRELETRWDFADSDFANGIPETFSIDQSQHSLFGVSKLAADLMVQEYGRYFGMKTVCFRGGCLTGPAHSGVELHGFLAYLFRCAKSQTKYTIYGYKGKQVRDHIHSEDVVRAIHAFYQNPRCGAVYNLGGGKRNSVSILESIERIEGLIGNKVKYIYNEANRPGDHICYYSDLSKFRRDYPEWSPAHSIDDIFEELARAVPLKREDKPIP